MEKPWGPSRATFFKHLQEHIICSLEFIYQAFGQGIRPKPCLPSCNILNVDRGPLLSDKALE